jgi:hypothetical protein
MDSTLICPYCKGSVTLLSLVSSVSVTDFYRCDDCEKVSESSKGANSPRALETRPEGGPKPEPAAFSPAVSPEWSDFSISSPTAFDRQFFFAGWRRAL